MQIGMQPEPVATQVSLGLLFAHFQKEAIVFCDFSYVEDVKLEEGFPAVLDAARQGSEEAWISLYRRFAPSVRGYLRSRGAMEPDDLTGEVFLQVVVHIGRFTGDESDFRSWLFTITHRRFLDERRRLRRRRDEPAPEELIHWRASVGDAESDALRKLQAAELRSLIGALTPGQQDVLLLRIFGELSINDVARVLGRRPGAIKQLQRRALESLKRELNGHA
jgi:RNA polymerase sigma factor (sigma-70 family)